MNLLVATALFACAGPLVEVSEQTLEVREKVYFAPGTANLSPLSDPLLGELAQALAANPRFTRVTIEGHTDSTGVAEKNLVLSRARAAVVRAALVERGIAGERLVAEGYGGEKAIATNETEAGRALNRRVEFVVDVLGKRGKRPPPAKVSAARNRVEAREPSREAWQRAPVGLGLYKLWRVQSRERSSAEVTFRDASRLQLREDTLVIVYGASSRGARRITSEAELQRGTLRTRLDELAGQSVTVKTPAGEAEFGGGSGLLAAFPDGESVLSNHQGQPAQLRSRGKRRAVKVSAGFGSKVTPIAPPTPPRPLPPAPAWSNKPPAFVAAVGEVVVDAGWTAPKGAAFTRVEVLDGDRVVDAVLVTAAVDRVSLRSLPTGRYQMRLATVDDERFESAPGEAAAFEVLRLDPPPGRKGAFVVPGDRLGAEGALRGRSRETGVRCSPETVPGPGAHTVQCSAGDRAFPAFVLQGAQITPRAARPILVSKKRARLVEILVDSPLPLDQLPIELELGPGLEQDGELQMRPFGASLRLRATADAPPSTTLRFSHKGARLFTMPVSVVP